MSNQQQQQQQQQKPSAITSFTVEFGDDTNRSVIVSTTRQHLRGHWGLAKLYARDGGGPDAGRAMSAMPEIPGIHMRVYSDGRVVTYDPLEDMPELLDRINRVMRSAAAIWSGQPITFVPRSETRLDRDHYTTLVEELKRKVESGTARVVTGDWPAKLPGRELFDVFSNGRKVKYKDQFEDWANALDRTTD